MMKLRYLFLMTVLLTVAACGGRAARDPEFSGEVEIPDQSEEGNEERFEVTPLPTGDFRQLDDLSATQAAAPEAAVEDGLATPVSQVPEIVNPPTRVPAGVAVEMPITSEDGLLNEDPLEAAIFDEIQFIQSGGPFNETESVRLFQDGTLIRNDVESSVSLDIVFEVDSILDDINFFQLTGTFKPVVPTNGAFQYAIQVDRAGDSRTLLTEDNLTPPQLRRLFQRLLLVGQESTANPADLAALRNPEP